MRRFLCLMLCVIFICQFFACAKVAEGRSYCTITANYDGDRQVSGSVELNYFNDTDTEITELTFSLYANAYSEGAEGKPVAEEDMANAYPDGPSYGSITVLACFEEGQPAEWRIEGTDGQILVLCLKKGVFPDESTAVKVDFVTEIPLARLRLGINGDSVNLGDFYPAICSHGRGGFRTYPYTPIGDPYCYPCVDYTVCLTVPGEYTVASGGDCVSTEVGAYTTEYCYEIKGGRGVAFVLNKNFEVLAGSADDVPVYVYTTGADGKKMLSAAVDAVRLFSRIFGEYPYGSLAVATTGFIQGGMEYSSTCFVSDELEGEELISCVVHEIAHQWWYGSVGFNEAEEPFLDEGLCEYSTLLFYEEYPVYGVSGEELRKRKNSEYRAIYGVLDDLGVENAGDLRRSIYEYNSGLDYAFTCYVKSFVMIEAFGQSFGKKRIIKGLRRLNEEYAGRTADLGALSSCLGGRGAEKFFSSFMQGRAVL